MELGKGGNGQQIILTGEMYKAVTEQLSDLLMKTRSRLIVLADTSGYAITQKGSSAGFNVNSLAVLAAGHFSATEEMAKKIGEKKRFKFIFHEGEDMNMYTCNVGDNYLLLVIFDVSIALGMIRLYTARTIKSIQELIDQNIEVDEKASEFLDIEFSTLLNQELDKSFNKYDL